MERLLRIKYLNRIAHVRHTFAFDKGGKSAFAISSNRIGFALSRMMAVNDHAGILAGTVLHIDHEGRTIWQAQARSGGENGQARNTTQNNVRTPTQQGSSSPSIPIASAVSAISSALKTVT